VVGKSHHLRGGVSLEEQTIETTAIERLWMV